MSWLALGLGALVGGVLGLVGGGGSLLAVPLLGLLGLDAGEAKAGALLVVAVAAIAGLVPHLRARTVDARAALLVGAAGAPASLLTAVAARSLSDAVQSALFALVAGVAGALLLRPARAERPVDVAPPPRLARTLLAGAGAGALTGLVGVGGGFVVVPVLALVVGLPPRRAVATSLVVVAVNAIAGHAGAASHVSATALPSTFLGGAILGAIGGAALASRVPQAHLRRLLGAVLLVVAVVMLVSATRPRPDAPAIDRGPLPVSTTSTLDE